MGTLFVVATPIGNLKDISPRAIEVLSTVDYILAEDTRHTLKLLNHYGIKNKLMSYHKFNEENKSKGIIDDLKNNKTIALVSDAGTPCISDPGYIIVKRAREEEITVIGISGPSAVITALSISAIDTSTFSFYGFVPTDNKKKRAFFDGIKKSNTKAIVIYESPKRIIKLAEKILEELPKSVVCFCSDLSKLYETSYYGPIKEVLKHLKDNEKVGLGEYTVVISNYEKPIAKKDPLSVEAKLIDQMIKNDITIKEATDIVSKDAKISKSLVYKAGLNIKNMFL